MAADWQQFTRCAPASGLVPAIAPDRRLGPSKMFELIGPKWRLAGRKEFIELRRRDARAGQHGMRLAAMMDIMLEQMHEQSVAPLGLHFRVAVDFHDVVEACGRQRIAHRHQPPVDRGLRRRQFGDRPIRNGIFPRLRSEPPALQRVDIAEVDDIDVIQRRLQARKEAGPRGFELGLIERGAGGQQAVIGPGIVVGEGAIGLLLWIQPATSMSPSRTTTG